DRVNGAIDSDTAGQTTNGFDRIFRVVIDDFGSLRPRHVQPRSDRIHGQNTAGTEQLGADNGELTDGTAAEDDHGISGLDLRQFRAEVGGGEDVGEENRLIIRYLRREFDETNRSKRNACPLGLQSVERASRFGTAIESRARERSVGIGIVALRVVAAATIRAAAASDGGGNDDAVADLEITHIGAEFLNDAHAFMSEDGARFHAGQRAANHVQIRPANGTGGEMNDGISRLLDLGFRHIVDTNIPHPMKYDGFHGLSSSNDSV